MCDRLVNLLTVLQTEKAGTLRVANETESTISFAQQAENFVPDCSGFRDFLYINC